jgi:hypothetical protein
MTVDLLMAALKIGPNDEVISNIIGHNDEIIYEEDAKEDKMYTFIVLHFLQRIIHPIQDKIERPVDFDWYYKKKDGSEPLGPMFKKDCHDPVVVLDCLEEIYRILKKYEADLPKVYWFCEDMDIKIKPCSQSMNIYIQDDLAYLSGSQGYCYATFSGKNIDIKNETNIAGFKAIKNPSGKEPEYTKGEPITVYLHSVSIFKSLGHFVMEMIEICKLGIQDNRMIFTEYA